MVNARKGGLLEQGTLTAPAPNAEAQLQFLAKLQRIFSEGDFTATYKCALLQALADEAVEQGTDTGEALEIAHRSLGQRFVALYWRHALPYGLDQPGRRIGVLAQNAGAQAAVVTAIACFREQAPGISLAAAASHPGYGQLLSGVTRTVAAQPLTYLQNLAGARDEFLYESSGRGRIRLLPGVAYCLRRFYPLIQQLTRSQWIGLIKRNSANTAILGDTDDLSEFLFGTPRQCLAALGQALRKLDGAKCFYCCRDLAAGDVDHMLPFSLYPRDLAANMVLACEACNRSKSDTLVAKSHLQRWRDRLDTRSQQLTEIGESVGMPQAREVLLSVARWAYGAAAAGGSRAWHASKVYQTIDRSYLDYLQS
jgi:HNH endonuclease